VKYELLKSEAVDTPTGELFKTGKKMGQIKTLKKYKCAHCNGMFRATEVQVDHIIPAGSLQSFDDLQGFAERLFCGPENLQLVCKPCHVIKTKEDRDNK
jgi:5-methylcytosine-specific restriction endonuclease McrA